MHEPTSDDRPSHGVAETATWLDRVATIIANHMSIARRVTTTCPIGCRHRHVTALAEATAGKGMVPVT